MARVSKIIKLIEWVILGIMRCHDCKINVSTHSGIQEYAYMVYDHIWEKAGMSSQGGMLCIRCLERRLGRKLTKDDFDSLVPINSGRIFEQSKRLQERLQGWQSKLDFDP